MKDITESDIKDNIPLVCGVNNKWLADIKIFGPCTVESVDQMEKVASVLIENNVKYIRGGAYKPLTFPYRNNQMYELRKEGVDILKHIKQVYDLKIVSEVTEISTIDHIHDVYDIIQIGARNMYNYELLKQVGSLSKPVLLKRHFGASMRDFLGAAEYLLHTGNDRVILCERGVISNNTHSATSRFVADIQIIPMIKKYTGLPIIFDPSHSTFNRDIVQNMTFAAIAAGADGYIIESHPTPDTAAVDRLNHIPLEHISELISKCDCIKNIVN